MRYSKYLKSKLNDVIVGVSIDSTFIRNLKKDFTRIRKLDFNSTFITVLTMGGNSLDHELLELFNYGDLVPTASAFVQARDKILPSNFEPDEIKHLYQLRWEIETYFRLHKYAVGLSNFHAKKKDSFIQEVYVRLTLHNFCESIFQNEILFNLATTHYYKINFTRAVQICCKYLRLLNTIFISVEARIRKYLSPVQKNRTFTRIHRKKTFTSFIYKVS